MKKETRQIKKYTDTEIDEYDNNSHFNYISG